MQFPSSSLRKLSQNGFNMDLRPYQREAVDAAYADLCIMPGNPIVDLPTGSGKSVVIAEIARRAVQQWSGRVLVLAHRKELLEQNANKLRSLLPKTVGVGLYSAGLRRFQAEEPVVCAGIQSVFRQPEIFGARHLCLIDEVHLVPSNGEGMYQTFLKGLREINPQLRLVGLTATPYRTDSGSLCDPDGMFQRICYTASIPALIDDGYLCPMTSKPSDLGYDTSNLHIRGGEFIERELQQLFDGDAEKVVEACKEIVGKTLDRKSIIVFCCGIGHATRVSRVIEKLTGQQVGLVTGDTTPIERATLLENFRNQSLRWLVNVDVLTTGFDAPAIDAIAILRSTASPGLFAQICGRGLRIDPSKSECLVLDFGSNIQRHGPIDAIDFGRRKTKDANGEKQDGPTKICPSCRLEQPAGKRNCECGWQFPPPELRHDETADTASEIISKPVEFDVIAWTLSEHRKKKAEPDAPSTLRVDYTVTESGAERGNLSEQVISEWVCIEHDGFAGKNAGKWWAQHSLADRPAFADEAVELWQRGAVIAPIRITAIRDGRWWRITQRVVADELPTEWADEVDHEALFQADSEAF